MAAKSTSQRPATVKAYLDALPEDRRKVLRAVRAAVNRRLPKGYEEGMQYGMIGWYVPHRLHPEGYHCDPKQPVPFAGLASQKNHMALYLMCIYGDPAHRAWFEQAWKQEVGRIDMGKGCVRFKKLADVPLDVVEEAIARVPVADFLERYTASVPRSRKRSARRKT
jgi:hypothetical protein